MKARLAADLERLNRWQSARPTSLDDRTDEADDQETSQPSKRGRTS